jgi:type IV pilus assembly protein PilN
MKITLNLASQPYVDQRAVLKRLRIAMLALAIIAIPLFLLLRTEQKKAESATLRVDAVHHNVQALEHQQQSYRTLMQQPQNAAVLTQSDYLNSLFRRKAFSWTATMTDLETVLPAGVQVLSLDPAITKSGTVVIHLRVSGARDRAIELVQNLEKSKDFAAPRLAGETLAQTTGLGNAFQPVSASTAVNFDILADYRPPAPADKLEKDGGNAEKEKEQKDAEPSGKKNEARPAAPAVPKRRTR